jgi:recombination protein RecA
MGDFLKGVQKDFKEINPDIISDPKRIVQFISSGNFVFNIIANQFYVGGWPRRRISEVFGMEHSGKSSLMYATFAELQRAGGVGILLDYEGSWEPQYAKRTFGLVEDGKTFVVFQPDTVEEGDKVFERMQYLSKIDLLVIDSVDAMKPQALIECALNKEARVGAHATAVGKVVAKFRRFARFKNCAVVFTNQIRSKINTNQSIQNTGTGAGFNVMEPYTTPGGWALRFYASLRMKLEFSAQLKDKLEVNAIGGESEEHGIRIGNRIKIINVKNKVGPPMLKYTTHFRFPTAHDPGGWDEVADIMYILKKRGRLQQVKGSLKYRGLDINEWHYTGSKYTCEEAFRTNKKLVEDGRKLILSLMKADDVLETVERGDIDEDDIAYQNNMHPSVDIDTSKDENDDDDFDNGNEDDTSPIKNISL